MRSRDYKKLIFYQSIANIDYILHILKNSPKNSCVIVVTGGSHFFEIIKKLNLKEKFGIELIDFSQPKIYNPVEIIKFLYKIKSGEIIKRLKRYKFSKAYFNCYNTDFVTPIILSIVDIKKIYFCQYKMVQKDEANIYFPANFKWIIKKLILQLILYKYKINTSYSGRDGFRRIIFKITSKKIFLKKLPFLKLNDEFLIPLNFISKKRKVIFMDSNQERFIGDNYSIIINQLFRILENCKYEVIIKKKPGTLLSNTLKKIKKENLITSKIPIELYNLKKIDLIIGVSSTGLVHVANQNPGIKVVSCLLLFYNYKKRVNENVKNVKNIITFLKARDLRKKIFFPKQTNEFKKAILSLSKSKLK